MEYGRYLKEVVQALESDVNFRKKLETAEVDDIKVMSCFQLQGICNTIQLCKKCENKNRVVNLIMC